MYVLPNRMPEIPYLTQDEHSVAAITRTIEAVFLLGLQKKLLFLVPVTGKSR